MRDLDLLLEILVFLGHVKRVRNYAKILGGVGCVVHFIGVEKFPFKKKSIGEKEWPKEKRDFPLVM